MTSSSVDVPGDGRAALRARLARGRRKKFVILAIAAVAVLSTVLGVSFTADTGTATATLDTSQLGAATLVYSQGTTLTTLEGDNVVWDHGNTAPKIAQVTVGQNGSVTTAGDIAFVDATTAGTPAGGHIDISAYVTNAAAFSAPYPTFSLPVELYCKAATAGSPPTLTWSGATQVGGPTYITDAQPSASWSVAPAANYFCEVTMETGGSFYTAATSTVTPSIYVTAQTSS
jgi:hypothetical protein